MQLISLKDIYSTEGKYVLVQVKEKEVETLPIV